MNTRQEAARTAQEPVSVREALEQRGDDLVIRDREEAVIGPEGEHARHFRRVRIASFEDLQRMSFIPEGLDEKRAMDAVARDNDAAFAAAMRGPADEAHGCGCGEGAAGGASAKATTSPLRTRYSRMRRTFNPQLARVLSETYRRDVQWDHALTTHVYRWIDRLVVMKEFDIGSILFRDIVVGRNSTLDVAAATKILWAGDIRIHVGGRIRTLGSYMKIRCATIQGNLA